MSTLNVSNITDGTTTLGTEYVVNGSAKAWVNFNGTGTVAIRDSLNVTSLTDNSSGDYNINFTNSMGNSNYCTPASCAYVSGFAQPSVGHHHIQPTKSVSYERLVVVYVSSVTDTTFVEASMMGDLA